MVTDVFKKGHLENVMTAVTFIHMDLQSWLMCEAVQMHNV